MVSLGGYNIFTILYNSVDECVIISVFSSRSESGNEEDDAQNIQHLSGRQLLALAELVVGNTRISQIVDEDDFILKSQN